MASDIKARYLEGWQQLEEALEGVTEEEAQAFRVTNWPQHEGWVGEDGSIAGLVWHCAAWKAGWADGVETGIPAQVREMRPEEDTWPGRLAWLHRSHQRLVAALDRLAASGEEAFTVNNKQRRPEEVDIFTGEHDAYHAAQIWYIRQTLAAGKQDRAG